MWVGREQGVRKVTTIAITGAAGLIGMRLIATLDRHPEVTRIVGLDRRAPQGVRSSRFVFRQVDVRDPQLERSFDGVDVLVHLAFQLDPIHDEQTMRAVNVDGTRNVVEAAERAGVGHLVYLSSVVAYGAATDNDLPLTEESPIRGTPDFNYAEHKRDVELWLERWLQHPHDLDVAILRPALVLGPGIENFLTRILEAPRFTQVRGHAPPLQFVHLDDVVSAIVHAIDQRLTGAYNVCAEGWLSFDEVAELVGRRPIAIPEELAFTMTERLWKLGIGEQPPGVVRHLMHPWVMSPSKLMATGWRPRITNRAALAETAAEHADHVSLVGVRTRWSTLRRVAVAAGAAGALLVGLGVRAWRRSRAQDPDEEPSAS